MITINSIASYVPQNFESNFDKQSQFGIDEKFIKEKLGISRVSRKLEDEDTADMCVRAFKSLQNDVGLDVDQVDCIVVCSQNPHGNGIPHTSALLQGMLGASTQTATFDISLGCSGYVYGLSVISSFMEASDLQCGLLFTCDPYSKIVDPLDKNTALLFGDAASVTLLEANKRRTSNWQPSNFKFYTDGKSGSALNNDEKSLFMNGRAVFNFSATTVPSQVESVMVSSGLDAQEIDLFLFHQGSKYIVDAITKRMCLAAEKVPTRLYEHGNTVSSSIPLLLEDNFDRQGVSRIILSGFGVGLSVASCLLQKS